MFKRVFSSSFFIAFLAISACGGSSGNSNDSDSTSLLTGVFLDSAVSGISYTTESQSGITNTAGEFRYVAGETLTLSIGNLPLPSVLAMDSLSPLDLFNTNDVSDIRVVNLSRLLQSLDVDGDPSNGIEISESVSAATTSTSIDFSQDQETFENNVDVINLVANSGSSNAVLITADDAILHLQNTLATVGDLETLDKTAFSNLISGNTFVFSAGTSIFYREDGTKFSRRQGGDEFIGMWSLVDGLVCEDVRGGESTFCLADSENFIVTRHPSSDSYYYSETGFSSPDQ